MRLHETAGAPTRAEVRLEGGPPVEVDMGPYALKTLRVTRQGGQIEWTEINLLES